MNNRRLRIVLLIIIVLNAHQVIAQANKRESFSINFGPEVSFIETSIRKTHSAGYGGSVKAEYTFSKHGSVTINSGVSIFSGKSFLDPITSRQTDYKSIIAIPIKVGARYYLGTFYATGETGVVVLTNFFNSTRPVFSIGMGDKFRIGSGKLDISLRQEFWPGGSNNLSLAVLRVGYEISW